MKHYIHLSKSIRQSMLAIGILTAIASCMGADGDIFDPEKIEAGANDTLSNDTTPTKNEKTCPDGFERCGDACIDTQKDYNHCGGCGISCLALPHVKIAACEQGSCKILGCESEPAFDDCNGVVEDGCEASLDAATSCGSCDEECAGDTPLCAKSPESQSKICVATCVDTETPNYCGTTCVNTQSDPAHCGGCDSPCPKSSNGQATCDNEVCGVVCDAGYHSCRGQWDCEDTPGFYTCPQDLHCEANTSVKSCGDRCEPCAEPDNADATCDGTTCDFVCHRGYRREDNQCERIWEPVELPGDGKQSTFMRRIRSAPNGGIYTLGGFYYSGETPLFFADAFGLRRVTSGTSQEIMDFSIDNTDIWAVGRGDILLRKKNEVSWRQVAEMTNRGNGSQFRTIMTLASGLFMAGGIEYSEERPGYGMATIMRSKDSGQSWETLRLPGRFYEGVKRLWAASQESVYATTDDRLWISRNAGDAWVDISPPSQGSDTRWNGIWGPNGQQVFVVGSYRDNNYQQTGLAFFSPDGGKTWQRRFRMEPGLDKREFRGIWGRDSNTVWLISPGDIYSSTDGGRTFVAQDIEHGTVFYDIGADRNGKPYAVGVGVKNDNDQVLYLNE